MSRLFWRFTTLSAVAVAALVAVSLIILQPWHEGSRHRVFAQGGLHASLDVIPWNGSGPCNPIDNQANVGAGTYDVAVCVGSAAESLASFQFGITYNPGLSSCADVACESGDCLDDNPDANTGSALGSGVPTTPGLGTGWDCNILDMEEPTCNKDGGAKAWMACYNLTGPFVSPTGDVAFPLGMITFGTVVEGNDTLTLGDVVLGDVWGMEMGTCSPAQGYPISCLGAAVDLCDGDLDCDGILDGVDNCPEVDNFDQANSDGPCRANGSELPGECTSNPAADLLGDACDPDDDNDALPDASENGLSCPSRIVGDSDGDGSLDSYEVANGKDPCNPASKLRCSGISDTDGDGIKDCTEHAGYDTCASVGDTMPSYTDCSDSIDSDNDVCPDWVEIGDVDGNRHVNILDVQWVAKRAFGFIPPSDSDRVLDVDKDGAVNIIDVRTEAINSSLLRPHEPCASEA